MTDNLNERDLGAHFPLYRDGVIGEYWKRLAYSVFFDDAFEVFGYAHVDDGDTAGTDDDDILMVAPGVMELRRAFAVSEDGHTGQATNYKTLKLINKESGSGSDEMAGEDYDNGNDLTQDDAELIAVNGTEANRQLADQDVVQVQLGHAGSGQAMGPVYVFGEFERFVDISNNIAQEKVILKAPHNIRVVAAYVIPLAGSITGQDTDTASIDIVDKGQAGSGSTVVASIDFTNGTDATEDVPTAMTLNSTISNLRIDRGDVLVAQLKKLDDGLQLNEVQVVLFCKAIETT